jgi:hypothetical protein
MIKNIIIFLLVGFILTLGVFSTISIIGQKKAEYQEKLVQFDKLLLRGEDILAVEACGEGVFEEMETILDNYSKNSGIINRLFIDDTELKAFETKYQVQKERGAQYCK